ncbi:hypothetical protein VIGAN_07092200, partial [Vigna angularis var. angularis]
HYQPVKVLEQQVAPPPFPLLSSTFHGYVLALFIASSSLSFLTISFKQSLSLSLKHFFPFASNLIIPPQLHLSNISYLHGDSLSFTIAESTAH